MGAVPARHGAVRGAWPSSARGAGGTGRRCRPRDLSWATGGARRSRAGPGRWRVGRSPRVPTWATASRTSRARVLVLKYRPAPHRAGDLDQLAAELRGRLLEDRRGRLPSARKARSAGSPPRSPWRRTAPARPRASRSWKSSRRFASSSRRLVRTSRKARQPEDPQDQRQDLVPQGHAQQHHAAEESPRSNRARAPPARDSAPDRSAGDGRAAGRPSSAAGSGPSAGRSPSPCRRSAAPSPGSGTGSRSPTGP